jgi:hypothetical protein
MAFRFQRRVSILPGLRVNLSKSGASLSIGHRGLWWTVGPRGQRATVGIPGSGLFWTHQYPPMHAHPHAGPPTIAPPRRPLAPPTRGEQAAFLIVMRSCSRYSSSLRRSRRIEGRWLAASEPPTSPVSGERIRRTA